jgi:hypothetical protein
MLHEGEASGVKLVELRGMYEPYIHALSIYFQVSIPPWIDAEKRPDNWQGNIEEPKSTARKEARVRGKRWH